MLDTLSAYASIYLLVDIYCMVIGTLIIRKVGNSFGSELEIRFFKEMIGFYLLFCLTDGLLLPLTVNLVPVQNAIYSLLMSLNMASMALAAYFWFCYAQIRMHLADMENHRIIVVSQIPMILLVLLYVTNPLTGWMYHIASDGAVVMGPLYLLTALFTGGYILWVAGQGLVNMKRAKTKTRRDDYLIYVRFAVIPTISSIVDPLLPHMPIMALCLLASILLVFSSLQEARIFNDALTGLNNRRRASQYISSKIASATAENPVYLYVLDVNLFKRINDTRGHIEGDRALCVVADGLRRAAGKSKGFAARWGGDEFVLVVDANNTPNPADVVDVINDCMQEARSGADLDYELSVSTGYAACTSSAEEPDDLLNRADHMLYEAKRQLHQAA